MSGSPFRKVAEKLAEDWLRIPHLSASDLAERAIELAVKAALSQDWQKPFQTTEDRRSAIAIRIEELMKESNRGPA